MQQPEANIGGADELFDQAGQLTEESTRAFLQKFIVSFARLSFSLSWRHVLPSMNAIFPFSVAASHQKMNSS
jgi:hypothetical protein